jgi:predicted NBD/HSP70 family sugar kinase
MLVAVDVGGTKTLVAGFNGNELLFEQRFVTPQDQDVFLTDLLATLKPYELKINILSIAVPGMIDQHSGAVISCGNLPWKNFELRTLIKRHIDCHVFIENDANLAGLGETHNLHKIPQTSLYITVSTGIGIGIIINGKILPALSQSEAGHMMLRRQGKLQKWQSYASGRALKDRTGQFAADIKDDIIWQDVADRVADGLYTLIPTLQPNVIIVGGSIGTYFEQYWHHHLEALLLKNISEYIHVPPLVQAKTPEEAVLYGCKLHARHQLSS